MSAPTHLTAVVRNAQMLRDRGDLPGARMVLIEALSVAGAAYGYDHPEVLHTAQLLAAIDRQAGALTSARRTLEEALAAGQLSRPADDPVMLLLTYDLGLVADELGNRHEARRGLSLVARLGPAVLGAEHPAVRSAQHYVDGVQSAPSSQPDRAAEPGTPSQPDPSSQPDRAAEPGTPSQRAPSSQPDRAAEPGTPSQRAPSSQPGTPSRPVPPAAAVPLRTDPATLRQRPGRRRTPMLVAGLTAALVALAVLTGAVLTGAVLLPRQPVAAPEAADPPPASPTPPAHPAPNGVRLLDNGGTITVTWVDPTAGGTPFIVSGARAGEQARPFANLPVGTTRYTVNGLNPRLEYCFTVVAVYSTELFAVSDLVCTTRSASPSPSPPRPGR